MASPQAEMFNAAIRAFRDSVVPDGPPPTIEQQRAGADAVMESVGAMPQGVTVTETSVAGLHTLLSVPDGAASDRAVLYLHGGGYVVNSARSHQRVSSSIAVAAGTQVYSVDYRLAPEHQHPAAVTDALAAYRWLLEQGYAPGRIALAGDSAGGGLAVATLVSAREAGLPQPAGAALLSPWVDLEGTGESMRTKAESDLLVSANALVIMATLFAPGDLARHPLASPIHADLHGLAPLYIQVGGDETLLDDSTRLATRAAHAGVDVRLDVFPEMQHVFQMAVGQVPESDDAVARIGGWLRTRLG